MSNCNHGNPLFGCPACDAHVIAELRAEVQRKNNWIERKARHCEIADKTIDDLRAENQSLRLDNERLRGEVKRWLAAYTLCKNELTAATEREQFLLGLIERAEHAMNCPNLYFRWDSEAPGHRLKGACNCFKSKVGGAIPIPMLLVCPGCGYPHVDQDEWATTRHHRKHLCAQCGVIWKPANLYTVGVERLAGDPG